MLLDGKTGMCLGWLISGASRGPSRGAREEVARIALIYQGERLEENARELAAVLKDPLVLPAM